MSNSYGKSSKTTTKAAFSIASSDALLAPFEKNDDLTRAQCVLTPAVNAANFSSPGCGSDWSLSICSICLKMNGFYIIP